MQGILDVFTLNPHPPASSSQIQSYIFTPLIFLVLLKKKITHAIQFVLPIYPWVRRQPLYHGQPTSNHVLK